MTKKRATTTKKHARLCGSPTNPKMIVAQTRATPTTSETFGPPTEKKSRSFTTRRRRQSDSKPIPQNERVRYKEAALFKKMNSQHR